MKQPLSPPPGQPVRLADYDPEFAISPDGSHVAFTTMDDRGERQLWVRALGDFLKGLPERAPSAVVWPRWASRHETAAA